MITLYGRETSSNVQAVRWALTELGIGFERINVGGEFGGLESSEFLDMNPNGKIPVITVDGEAIFESSAILRYVAASAGDEDLWPSEPLLRAQIDKWAEWAKREGADAFTGPIFWRVVRTPAERHDHNAIRTAVDKFEAAMSIADAELARHAYLAGETFSLADIVLGHILYRYYDIDIPRRDMPNLHAYYDRLTERSAYREAVMISYDSLRNTI